ncbi:YhjD/YihY/BrkB family envelope integrity protein [Gordonia sp. (in: high G+C Gram-positive bacteria)]|uniref:YhjD/YihY/BrkB family envelope integrity protein n=1 Tax=Gordonia sp. (in: high G+C Gram-positive bacteria) TaxID=84139 RepID=UPI003C734C11
MDRIKALIARVKDWFDALVGRWGFLGHIMGTVERYNHQRGNSYAAAISFIGILSLVPILMVSFAIAGFALVWYPTLLDDLTNLIVENLPGEFGDQLKSVIDSAIDSRQAVGLIGLGTAVLTGIGWMSLLRNGITEMWGGRVKHNPILGKLYDLMIFFILGILFIVTTGITIISAGGLGPKILDWLGITSNDLTALLLRVASIVISVLGMWLLFIVILAWLPRNDVPARAILWSALATALVFEVLKSVAGIYLQSILGSPAGAAFGPIIGIMVFSYLAARVILYAAAWSAADPANEKYLFVDEVPPPKPGEARQVVLAPVYEVEPENQARRLLAAAGVGAVVASAVGWLKRGKR